MGGWGRVELFDRVRGNKTESERIAGTEDKEWWGEGENAVLNALGWWGGDLNLLIASK